MTLGWGIFSGIICFLYTDTHTHFLANLTGSFVFFRITSMLFHLTFRRAINFLSKRDITAAWQRDISAAGKKPHTCLKKCQNVDVPPRI